MIYFTSDLHLGHESVIRMQNRKLPKATGIICKRKKLENRKDKESAENSERDLMPFFYVDFNFDY